MKKVFLYFIIFLTTSVGCEKEKSPVYSSSLIGKWSWLISCGGFAGCSTPQSTGVTMTLVFSQDSTWFRYLNDTLEATGRFYTYKTVTANNLNTNDIIQMGSIVEKYIIHNDTLDLEAIDYLLGSGWKRIK